MSDKEWSPANILDVFGDPIARATLVLASDHPVTVQDIAKQLEVSTPTIYRRIDPLVDRNLLREHQQIDEKGNQPSEYQTTLDEVTFKINTNGYTVDLQVRQDLADDFESLWTDLEGASRQGDGSRQTTSTRPTDKWSDLS